METEKYSETRLLVMFDESMDDVMENVFILGHEFLPSRILKKMAPAEYKTEFETWIFENGYEICEDASQWPDEDLDDNTGGQ